MITATVQDFLLAQPRKHGDGRPYVLPQMSRDDLPGLCRDMGFTKGAEIGVWRGAFSAKFCEANPRMHMLCVDPWEPHDDWIDTKNAMPKEQAKAFMAESYRDAVKRLRGLKATIVRKFSVEAATEVPDASLDLAYVDGNHVFNAVLNDLNAWAPKVRSGGLLAGHDFREFPNKPFVQVIPAVKAYTQAHGIDPWFVLAAERTPSFAWVVR